MLPPWLTIVSLPASLACGEVGNTEEKVELWRSAEVAEHLQLSGALP